MKIDLQVEATFCNEWPILVVEVNGAVIYRKQIEGKTTVTLQHTDLKPSGNRFIVGMEGKRFGRNGVWDTKSRDNKIVQDKTINVVSVKLDDVECKSLFDHKFFVQRVDKQPSYFPDVVESIGMMNYNGYFTFDFDTPLYNSLINKKFKKPMDSDLSYYSNYTKVFHYEEETEVINSIYDILKEIDEKFSGKRSKIRNT